MNTDSDDRFLRCFWDADGNRLPAVTNNNHCLISIIGVQKIDCACFFHPCLSASILGRNHFGLLSSDDNFSSALDKSAGSSFGAGPGFTGDTAGSVALVSVLSFCSFTLGSVWGTGCGRAAGR